MTMTARSTSTFQVRRPEFSARILVDRRNERIKLISYQNTTEDVAPLTDFLLQTAREHGMGKAVITARGLDWRAFQTRGYALEGTVERFYQGTPGHFMAYFLTGERQTTERLEEKQTLLQSLLEQPAGAGEVPPLPEGSSLEVAGPELAAELAAVYDQVFESYPSPLTDPDYVRELIESGDGLFMVTTAEGQITSAAAAEIDRAHGNAEITNCATLPDFRGEGLMSILIDALHQEMDRQQIPCLYSMARALSPGMNRALQRFGYTFRGRLVNHVHIGGGYEDLNLWERSL